MAMKKLIQLEKQLGIVDEGDIVSDDDFEISLELTDEDIDILVSKKK